MRPGRPSEDALLALIAGALLPLSLAPVHAWPLAPISVALFYVSCERTSARGASGVWPMAALGFLFGLGKYGVGASWVYVSIHEHGGAPVPLAVLLVGLFVAFMALFPATQLAAFGKLRDRLAPPMLQGVTFIALWVLWEWLLTWVLSGFPWLFVGSGQIDGPLAAFAPVGGVLLLSTVTLIMGVALARGVLVRGRAARLRALLPGLAVLLLGLALAPVEWTQPTGTGRAALVQGNIPQATKWQPAQRAPILATMQRLSEPHWGVDLLLWPEAAITLYEHEAAPYLARWAERGRQAGTTLVLGLPAVEAVPVPGGETAYSFANLAVAVGAGSGRYRKRRLVPFGEYVPLEDLLRGLIRFFDLPMSHSSPGPMQQPLLRIGEQRAAMAICYEIAYPALVRGDMPAAVLLTISNDTWFGRSLGPEQHRQLARLRALELGRYLLRATNNGYTVIVDHRGRVTEALPRFEAGVLQGAYELRGGLTPFARFGHWPLLLGIGVALSLVLFLRARLRPAKDTEPP